MKSDNKIEKNEHGKHVLKLTINSKKFKWSSQYITGAEIRQLGEIEEGEEIFLAIKKPWKDELIDNETKVNLARPEIEHFFSKCKQKEVSLIVNGTPKKWDAKRISFEEVIILAYEKYIDKPTMAYTVAFEDGPRRNPEGSMVKNSVVFVKDKMIFHATATDKS